jgi:hypothetical protein
VDNAQPQSPASQTEPRRFIYRDADPAPSHPMRRCTDRPAPSAAIAGEICPRVRTVKMRVYFKLN